MMEERFMKQGGGKGREGKERRSSGRKKKEKEGNGTKKMNKKCQIMIKNK
jgi:hypothetical protein